MDVAAELPRLFPLAVAWAEEESARLQRDGTPLSDAAFVLARLVGVLDPARVRILVAPSIPLPKHRDLAAACAALDFLGARTLGLTLGSGVFLKKGFETGRQLVAHELRHVAQYERYGSIEAYLAVYIPDLIVHGAVRAPLERDAHRAALRCA